MVSQRCTGCNVKLAAELGFFRASIKHPIPFEPQTKSKPNPPLISTSPHTREIRQNSGQKETGAKLDIDVVDAKPEQRHILGKDPFQRVLTMS